MQWFNVNLWRDGVNTECQGLTQVVVRSDRELTEYEAVRLVVDAMREKSLTFVTFASVIAVYGDYTYYTVSNLACASESV